MRAREVAARFGDVKAETGDTYVVHCPGPNHENGDRRASLALTDSTDRVLGTCRSGNCDLGEVLAVKGLRLSDLFHEKNRPSGNREGGSLLNIGTKMRTVSIYTMWFNSTHPQATRKSSPSGG